MPSHEPSANRRPKVTKVTRIARKKPLFPIAVPGEDGARAVFEQAGLVLIVASTLRLAAVRT
jgi:hypothetical protein